MSLQQNQFNQIPVQGQVDLQFAPTVVAVEIVSTQVTPLVAGQGFKVADIAGGIPKVRSLVDDTEAADGFIAFNSKDVNYPAYAKAEGCLQGSVLYMTSGAAISRWAKIEVVAATTKVIANAGTNPVVGFAYDKATAANQLIRVYVLTQDVTAQTIGDIAGLQTALNALGSGVTEKITALSTVGAGTITAAGIAGGVTNRTGSTAAFTDTTDTATAIIAALPVAATVNQSFEYLYYNNTGFAATITGGSGVTIPASTLVPAGAWMRFLVVYTGAGAVSMTDIATGSIGTLPAAQFATGTTTTTFTAGELTGANDVTYTNTGATPGSIATRTATLMIADIPNAHIGQTWKLRIINGQGTGTLTVTAGSDVTLTGTATVAANTFRDFVCTITSIALHTITIQNAGTGTFS